MAVSEINIRNQRGFLRVVKKDFIKGLMPAEKEALKNYMENHAEARQYLTRSKRLDRDLRFESKKAFPAFDRAEDIARRCGIDITPRRSE